MNQVYPVCQGLTGINDWMIVPIAATCKNDWKQPEYTVKNMSALWQDMGQLGDRCVVIWCNKLLILVVSSVCAMPCAVPCVGGPLAEWLRHWTLNHEIIGSSPSIHLVSGN